MSQTITKSIGEGHDRGELYAALAYNSADKFGGMKIKSLMLNEDEKIYFRDADTYIYSDSAGSITVVGTSITLPSTMIPAYNEGFTMLTTSPIYFCDSGASVYSSSSGVLNLAGTTIVLTGAITVTGAPTITGNVAIVGTVDIDGIVTMAGTDGIEFTSDAAYINASSAGALVIAATSLAITAATDHTGVLEMQTNSKLQFYTDAAYINASSAGVLVISATTITVGGIVGITGATTITGAVTIAGAVGITGDVTMHASDQINFYDTGAYIQASASTALALVGTTIGLTGAITLTGTVAITDDITMATTKTVNFYDAGMYIGASSDAHLAIISDLELAITCPTVTITAATLVDLAGIVSVTDATDASAVGTASIYTAGGMGVTKKLYVGTDLVMVGGDIDFSTATTGLHDIIVKDNLADALSIKDNAADLMVFTTTTGGDKVAITPNLYCGAAITSTGHMHPKTTVTALTSGATVTYTAAQMVNCMISDHPSEACAATTHTATQIIAAIPNAVDGSQFWFILKNAADDASTITLTAGDDVTITGTATVAQNNTKLFFGIVTSVASHTVTIYSTGTMVH